MKSLLQLLDIFIHTDFSKLRVYTALGLFEKRIRNTGFELTNLQNLGDVHEETRANVQMERWSWPVMFIENTPSHVLLFEHSSHFQASGLYQSSTPQQEQLPKVLYRRKQPISWPTVVC